MLPFYSELNYKYGACSLSIIMRNASADLGRGRKKGEPCKKEGGIHTNVWSSFMQVIEGELAPLPLPETANEKMPNGRPFARNVTAVRPSCFLGRED